MIDSRGVEVRLEALLPSMEGSGRRIVREGRRLYFGSRRFKIRPRSGYSFSGRGNSSGAGSSMPFMEHHKNVCGALLKGLHELLCMVTRLGILNANEVLRDVEEFVSMFLYFF